jgi:hypothetical protein
MTRAPTPGPTFHVSIEGDDRAPDFLVLRFDGRTYEAQVAACTTVEAMVAAHRLLSLGERPRTQACGHHVVEGALCACWLDLLRHREERYGETWGT